VFWPYFSDLFVCLDPEIRHNLKALLSSIIYKIAVPGLQAFPFHVHPFLVTGSWELLHVLNVFLEPSTGVLLHLNCFPSALIHDDVRAFHRHGDELAMETGLLARLRAGDRKKLAVLKNILVLQ
jgi:hypothetical protein